LKSKPSVFSFDRRVFKILSLLSIDGRPTIILPDTKHIAVSKHIMKHVNILVSLSLNVSPPARFKKLQ
jgi:hypothetical protein